MAHGLHNTVSKNKFFSAEEVKMKKLLAITTFVIVTALYIYGNLGQRIYGCIYQTVLLPFCQKLINTKTPPICLICSEPIHLIDFIRP